MLICCETGLCVSRRTRHEGRGSNERLLIGATNVVTACTHTLSTFPSPPSPSGNVPREQTSKQDGRRARLQGDESETPHGSVCKSQKDVATKGPGNRGKSQIDTESGYFRLNCRRKLVGVAQGPKGPRLDKGIRLWLRRFPRTSSPFNFERRGAKGPDIDPRVGKGLSVPA